MSMIDALELSFLQSSIHLLDDIRDDGATSIAEAMLIISAKIKKRNLTPMREIPRNITICPVCGRDINIIAVDGYVIDKCKTGGCGWSMIRGELI